MKFSILFAVVAPLFTITEAASGFKDSCGGFPGGPYRLCGVPGPLEYPMSLCADCKKIDGSWQKSRINLDKCIVNAGGTLYGQQDGGFGNSVVNCIITYAGRTDMDCFIMSGDHPPSPPAQPGRTNVIDLNDFIGNDNGVLRCFDRWGDKV